MPQTLVQYLLMQNSGNPVLAAVNGILFVGFSAMHSFKLIANFVPLSWVLVLVISGIAAACAGAFESEETKAKRAELKKQKELRVLGHRISTYGQTVHERFPTGDVVVSERYVAEQLRKRPEAVVTAAESAAE